MGKIQDTLFIWRSAINLTFTIYLCFNIIKNDNGQIGRVDSERAGCLSRYPSSELVWSHAKNGCKEIGLKGMDAEVSRKRLRYGWIVPRNARGICVEEMIKYAKDMSEWKLIMN